MSAAIWRACSKLVAMPNRGAGRPALLEHLAELAAVLGQVDGLGAGADDRHAGVLEPLRQPERGLPAELHDHPDDTGTACAGGGFGVVDLEDVLEGQRLEVQPVGGVVVGRHRLGVAVDHDGLEAGLAQRRRGMHTAVVELDALADPVGPRPEDQHLRLLGLRRHLGLGGGIQLVAAVVVRRLGLELRGAGVDGLVDRVDAEPLRSARTPTSPASSGRSAAIWRSESPLCLAARSSSSSRTGASSSSARRATSPAIWSTNHGSTPEASATSLDRWRRGAVPARCRRAGRRSASAAAPAARRPCRRVRDRSRIRPARSPVNASPCRAPR